MMRTSPWRFLAAIHLCLALAWPAQTAPPPAEGAKSSPGSQTTSRMDLYGDPLPNGALARCGTTRFRTDSYGFCLSPDEKTMVMCTRGGLRVYELPSGKELYAFAFVTKMEAYLGSAGVRLLGFSTDGKKLALRRNEKLVVFDVDRGKPLWEYAGAPKEYPYAVFTNDGKELVSYAEDGVLRQWDTNTGKPIGKQVLLDTKDNLFAHSANEKLVAGRLRPDTVRVWDLTSGKELHTFTAASQNVDWLVFDAAGTKLATVDENRKVLHLFDISTAKQVEFSTEHTIYPIPLKFSPDGKVLASVSEDRDPIFYAWDGSTGQQLYKVSDEEPLRAFAFSPDAKTVALAYDHTIRLLEKTTGKIVSTLPSGVDSLAEENSLAFSRDGRWLIAHDGRSIRFWDVVTSMEAPRPQGHTGRVCDLAFSGDGRVLASRAEDDTVRVWEARSGKLVRSFVRPQDDWFGAVQLSFDGKTLATARHSGSALYTWEVATGKQLTKVEPDRRAFFLPFSDRIQMQFLPNATSLAISSRESPEVVFRQVKTGKQHTSLSQKGNVYSMPVSHDGNTLAVCRNGRDGKGIDFWNLATSRLHAIPTLKASGKPLFSPDDKLLAVLEEKCISVWEVATGKRVHEFSRVKYGLAAAFIPSGRLVAIARAEWPELATDLWDVLAEKRLHRFDFDGEDPVAFSSDGTLLATATPLTDVLVWDLLPHLSKARPPRAKLDPKTLDGLWTDLAGEDAARAFQAAQALSSSPDAVAFLKERLPPAKEKRLPGLMRDLDAKDFEVREAASKELARLGFDAEPALRLARAENKSAEVLQRVQSALEALEAKPPGPHLLRESRAVQALEFHGSIEARALLRSLAQGDPFARLTQDAKAALERLANRGTEP